MHALQTHGTIGSHSLPGRTSNHVDSPTTLLVCRLPS